MNLFVIAWLFLVGLLVMGCEDAKLPPSPQVVLLDPPKPAPECLSPDPKEPRLPERDLDAKTVVEHIEARKADRRALVALRKVCRVSLEAARSDSPPRTVAAAK